MLSKILSTSAKRVPSRSLARALGSDCVVNSHNEFDPLEEVIVGSVEGATIPEWHVSGKAVWPEKHWDFFKQKAGEPFPAWLMEGGESPRCLLSLTHSLTHSLYCFVSFFVVCSPFGTGWFRQDLGAGRRQGASP